MCLSLPTRTAPTIPPQHAKYVLGPRGLDSHLGGAVSWLHTLTPLLTGLPNPRRGTPQSSALTHPGYRSHPIQSANSRALGTVALRRMMETCSGSMMSTSSHTTPRCTRVGRRVSRGAEKTVRQGPRKTPRSPSAHLSIVDIVDFIKDDPLQVPDDI